MIQKINIPVRTHEEFGHSLSKLLKIISLIVASKNNEIELDFSQARMLNPFFLGGLACSLNHFESVGKKIQLNHTDNYNINSYLERIYFPACFQPAKGAENSFFEQLDNYKTKTYIPIIAFPTGSDQYHGAVREKVLNAVSALLKGQLNFREKERQPLSYFLDELTHNVNDHSGAAQGFLFAQFYPSSNYLDLVICDNGKGIYKSYEGNAKFHPKDEIEALQFAINGKSTKNIPESKGFGISTSRRMLVHGLRGRFFIWTGNTAYIETVERVNILDIPDNCYFQGTFVALRIPTIIPERFNFYEYVE
ncbi:MAG TPA: hypothetical protein VEC17_03395 [Candidatus Binatia bacterium]|nr:hypothetical protein [Candidatus Binatia bacterium]